VRPGGTIVYDSSVATAIPNLDPGIQQIGVPCTEVARELGKAMVKNVVAMGAMCEATSIFPRESFLASLAESLKSRCALVPLNEEAFQWGERRCREAMEDAN